MDLLFTCLCKYFFSISFKNRRAMTRETMFNRHNRNASVLWTTKWKLGWFENGFQMNLPAIQSGNYFPSDKSLLNIETIVAWDNYSLKMNGDLWSSSALSTLIRKVENDKHKYSLHSLLHSTFKLFFIFMCFTFLHAIWWPLNETKLPKSLNLVF